MTARSSVTARGHRPRLQMKAMFLPILLSVACAFAQAQSESGPIRGPILGFVLDDVKALRPILGIAGAATIGEPIPIEVRLADPVLAPGQKYAIATSEESAEIVVVKLDGSRVLVRPLPDALAYPDAIAISPDASSVAIYSEARRMVQVFTGLPDAAQKLGDFDLSTASGILRKMAISDRSPTGIPALVLAFSDERQNSDGSAVYVLDPENGLKLISRSEGISAVTFLPNSRDVVALDSRNDQVTLLRNVLEFTAVELLATVDDGIRKPAAVSVSSDGRRAFVVNAGSSEVVVLDLAKRVVTVASCPCMPSQIVPLATNVFFGLTLRLDKPVWLLDGRGETVNFVFVPAYRR